jgi:general secretion pathway protein G
MPHCCGESRSRGQGRPEHKNRAVQTGAASMPTKTLSDRSPTVRLATRRRAGRDAGFTLIELLIVLGILALLATLATPQVLRYLGKARTETAKVQINAIASALELYALDNGGYPAPQFGLNALVQRPHGATRWNGPYLKKAEGLKDPWGRDYQYRAPGRAGAFDVFTLGRDNAAGGTGEDSDVTN